MKSRKKSFWQNWLQSQEEGKKPTLGSQNEVCHQLYSNFSPMSTWEPNNLENICGRIRNVQFSPDGSLLVAVTQRNSILVFDPLNYKLLKHMGHAHENCVNNARFINSVIFATCSDDSTIALWDVRHLKNKLSSLVGHSHFVKNVEYDASSGLLLSSGYDGSVYSWDINRYSDNGIPFEKLFYTCDLASMKLSQNSEKMVLCTNDGYIMVVHNLNLTTLYKDLLGFEPSTYRLMNAECAPSTIANHYGHFFKANRNQVELITDFPHGNEAQIITSLEVHPYGWCILSRNWDSSSEWTCVHDVQKAENAGEEVFQLEEDAVTSLNLDLFSQNSFSVTPSTTSSVQPVGSESQQNTDYPSYQLFDQTNPLYRMRNATVLIQSSHFRDILLDTQIPELPDELESPVYNDIVTANSILNSLYSCVQNLNVRPSEASVPSAAGDSTGGSSLFRNSSSAYNALEDNNHRNSAIQVILRPVPSLEFSRTCDGSCKKHICQSKPRLTYYIEEANVAYGIPKEICFSGDGRIVCSPYGTRFRLLAFNSMCSELCDCIPSEPTRLHELSVTEDLLSTVTCTRFSPTHCLIASGCTGGRISFFQPVF